MDLAPKANSQERKKHYKEAMKTKSTCGVQTRHVLSVAGHVVSSISRHSTQ